MSFIILNCLCLLFSAIQLLRPFENDGHLEPIQRNFNRRLSRVRCRIEHTFGHAQSLWRRLQFLPCRNMDYALDHIVSSFVLHNFRILHGEEVHNVSAIIGSQIRQFLCVFKVDNLCS